MRCRLLPLLAAFLLLLTTTSSARGEEVIHSLANDFVVETPPAAPAMQLIDNPYRLTIFLNFDGAALTQGPSDSRSNKTDIIVVPSMDYPAFAGWNRMGGRDKGVAAIVDELKILFMKLAVEFVTTRPASGDYTMAMIGGMGEGVISGGDAVGISPLDCKNSNKNDVVLIFGDKMDGGAKEVALVIAHELGHSFGLEHVEDKTSIMYPALMSTTCCWTTSTVQAPSTCARTTQDDERVLLENVGAGPGDTSPPLCWFVRPGAGAVLPPNFSVEASALDDLRIHHVTLFLDGAKKLELPSGPYAAFFTNLPDGEHVLRAEAADWKPNVTNAEIKVTVDRSCTLKGTCLAGKLAFNAECSQSTQCGSDICAVKDGSGRCTMGCQGAGKLCPSGTTCQQSGDKWICTAGAGWAIETPPVEKHGGCALIASSSQSRTSVLIALLPLALALLLLRRRRRS